MDYNNFYQKKNWAQQEIIHAINLEGQIEKVQGFGEEAINNSTQQVYLKIYKNGQLMVIYDDSKVDKDTKPMQYLETQEVEKVLDGLGPDKNQIALKVDKSGWHFKVKNKYPEWSNAFLSLSKFYTNSKDVPQRNLESYIDYYTLMKIKSEQEQNFWSEVCSTIKKMQSFIKDKNLKSIIEKSNQASIRSRFVFAQLQIETEIRTDELKGKQKHPVKIKKSKDNNEDLQIMGKGPEYNMVLVTQNQGYIVDPEFEDTCQDVLKKQILPNKIDFNTCYFYIYDCPGDISPFKQGFSCSDIEFVYFTNDELQFKVQLCNQISTLHFKHNWQADMAYEGLKTGVLDALNVQRSSQKFLNFNIEYFYELMEKKDKKTLKQKLGSIVEKIDDQENIDDMIALLPKIIRDFDNFCNDFYSRQPFDIKFFTFCVYILHKNIRATIYSSYNHAIETIDGKSVYDLLKLLNQYQQILDKYKIKDINFGEWTSKLTKTLITKILENIKKMLTKIILNFQTDEGIDEDGGKYKTKSSQDLESQLNLIWGHYKDCPNVNVAVILGDSCFKLITIYLQCLIDLFKDPKQEIKQIIALANNDFIKMVKNMNKKISNDVGDQLNKKQVRALLEEDFLFQKIMKIEKMCYFAIKRNIIEQIDQDFDSDDFVNLDLKAIWDEALNTLQDYKSKLEQTKKIDGFENEMVERFFQLYLQKIISACDSTRNNRLQSLIDKFVNDEENMNEIIKQSSEEFQKQADFTYQSLKKFLISLNIDICLINLVNVQKFYPKLINEHSIDTLLKKKLCFEEDQIQYIQDFLQISLQLQKQRIQKEKQYGRKIYVAYLIHEFARIIQKSYHYKKKIQGKIEDAHLPKPSKANKDAPKKYSVPSVHGTVSFNTIFKQKAEVEYIIYSSKLEDAKAAKYLKDKLKKKGTFKKGFVLITIGGLSIYEDSSMSELVLNFPFVYASEVHRLAKHKKKKKGKDDKAKDNSKEFVLFFKNPLNGVGLFFKNLNPDLVDSWEKYLDAIQQNFNSSKYEIQEIDLSEHCTYLKWKSKKPDFSFNLDDYNDQKVPDVDFDVFDA